MECLSHNEKESPEKWHSSQHVNSQELGIYPATLPFFFFFFWFYPLNFSNHKSASTPWLHRCTGGSHKPKVMRGVQGWFGSLCCHWSTWATITAWLFWSFFFYVDWQLENVRPCWFAVKGISERLCDSFFFLFWDLMQEEETKKQPLITEPFHAVISLNKRK